MPIDLADSHLQILRRILENHVPDCEGWAFGSRICGRAKPFSDLDLAIVSPQGVSVRRLALLAEAFEESDLPIRIDILNWQTTSPSFQERLAAHHEVVFRPELSAAVGVMG